jgi:ribosomal protein L9
MKKRRRPIEVFNLSFLDVVSCGFGAIILLLVIAKISEPTVLERLAEDLRGALQNLQRQSDQLAKAAVPLERQLITRQAALAEAQAVLARLRAEQARLEARVREKKQVLATQDAIEAQLASAKQSLSEEMKRLLGAQHHRAAEDVTIGGIPVDSEYVIFIIDTSGSMHAITWPLVMRKVEQVLRIYPRVKGLQVMNDMGDYMFSQYAGRWIPDTPARRQAVIRRLASWEPFSNSSPVEGITRAISRFGAGDKRISLYVFGDDFSSGSIEAVLRTVEKLNHGAASGKPRVRIHAIGFPTLFDLQGGLSANSIRFAALMRALAERNAGSFVGLNSSR